MLLALMKQFFMKYNLCLLATLMTGFFSVIASAGLESRTFFSADKSKSFKGTLKSYDQSSGKVRVRTIKGRDKTFKISVLSDDCQAYITDNISKVAVASALDISIKQIKEKKSKGSDSSDYKYSVTFYNKGKSLLKDLDVDYTVYYKKDTIKRGVKATSLTSTGSFDISEIDPKYRKTDTTSPISITKKTIKGKGGG